RAGARHPAALRRQAQGRQPGERRDLLVGAQPRRSRDGEPRDRRVMPIEGAVPWQAELALRLGSPLVLLWIALAFGKTLRRDRVPLIAQIAQRSRSELPPPLARYTRRLTAIWCGYFVAAAIVSAILLWLSAASFSLLSVAILGGSVVLFVGEHWLRPRLFP